MHSSKYVFGLFENDYLILALKLNSHNFAKVALAKGLGLHTVLLPDRAPSLLGGPPLMLVLTPDWGGRLGRRASNPTLQNMLWIPVSTHEQGLPRLCCPHLMAARRSCHSRTGAACLFVQRGAVLQARWHCPSLHHHQKRWLLLPGLLAHMEDNVPA